MMTRLGMSRWERELALEEGVVVGYLASWINVIGCISLVSRVMRHKTSIYRIDDDEYLG